MYAIFFHSLNIYPSPIFLMGYYSMKLQSYLHIMKVYSFPVSETIGDRLGKYIFIVMVLLIIYLSVKKTSFLLVVIPVCAYSSFLLDFSSINRFTWII